MNLNNALEHISKGTISIGRDPVPVLIYQEMYSISISNKFYLLVELKVIVKRLRVNME